MSTVSSLPIAYAYSRFSTAEQAKGDSFARQTANAKRWADANGYRVEPRHDAGVSGYTGANLLGQLGVLLAELRAGKLGAKPILLIENFDRLSRQEIEESQSLFLEIINRGATVVTLHNSKAYKKPMSLTDIMQALIEMDLAHQESAKKSQRVREAYDRRRQRGACIHTGGNAPLWLKLIDRNAATIEGRWALNKPRVKLLKEIFKMAAGGLGQFKIAKALNQRKQPTWPQGKRVPAFWYAANLDKLIRSKMVLGVYEPEGREHQPGYFPAVITEKLWHDANSRIVRRGSSRGRSSDEANLVRGLAFSADDGTAMVHRRGATATPGIRKIYNAIAYTRTMLKQAKGTKRAELATELEQLLIERKTYHTERRARGEASYEYKYEQLVSMGTLNGTTQQPLRVKYQDLENGLLFLLRNVPLVTLACAKNREASFAAQQDLAQEWQNAAQKLVEKYTRSVERAPEPSEVLLGLLTKAERELKAAKVQVEHLTAAAIPRSLPQVNAEDLTNPDERRRVRAELAHWQHRIEVGRERFIVWVTEEEGFGVTYATDSKGCHTVTIEHAQPIDEDAENEAIGAA